MTNTPAWAVSVEVGPIVAPLANAPPLEALPPKEWQKARGGEPFRGPVNVVVESTGNGGKRAIVSNPMPNGPTFEIRCDEPPMLGGSDSAPTPLAYLSAGAGLCLMAHISGFLHLRPMNITRLKVEFRANFWSTLGHVLDGGQGEGGCDSCETFVIVDSDEPPERIAQLVELCERACIASQTIAQSIPTSLNVVVNGKTHKK